MASLSSGGWEKDALAKQGDVTIDTLLLDMEELSGTVQDVDAIILNEEV